MKARLGLAVASAIKPNILLIDEVLGVGDLEFQRGEIKKKNLGYGQRPKTKSLSYPTVQSSDVGHL